MRLFNRHHTKTNNSSNASQNPAQMPGLDPLAPNIRADGKGDYTDAVNESFDVGVTSDCNSRYRKSMEDSSVVIMDYMGIPNCAYFGIYDGHAGSQCALGVAEHLHCIVAEVLASQGTSKDVPLALSTAFQKMDEKLKGMDIRHSGSTAVVAISCYMSASNEIVARSTRDAVRKLFVANVGDSRAVLGTVEKPHELQPTITTAAGTKAEEENNVTEETDFAEGAQAQQGKPRQQSRGAPNDQHKSSESLSEDTASVRTVADVEQLGAVDVKRLSYDHRCTDIYEQKRVSNAGGIMINNRVNGMLAVTRSLGDLFMKDYVVGAPYTTETDLNPNSQEILVMACDGLWDVCSDDKSLQLASASLNEGKSSLATSQELLDYALAEFSVDNLTVMVVQFKV